MQIDPRLAWPAVLLLACCPLQAEWLLNAHGESQRYQVFEFSADGRVKNLAPLPAPHRSSGVAWPSGMRDGQSTVAYASVLREGKWASVDRWVRTAGRWKWEGTALAASTSEPHGIGPAWVGSEAGQWIMYYLLRGPDGPGYEIHRATSRDGVNWRRRGRVFRAAEPLSLATACRASSGQVVLSLQVYDSKYATAAAHLATAPGTAGPFAMGGPVLKPDKWSSNLSGRAGEALATLPGGPAPRLGVPLVFHTTGEVIVPAKRSGTVIHLESPLLHDYRSAPVSSIGRNKVEISHLSELPQGGWRATITGYGAVANKLHEYTTDIAAPRLGGPWRYVGNGLTFKPFFAEGRNSTENPHRISDGMRCR